MNSFSDISQISDITSISRISRSNCSRLFGRIDSLNNLHESQSNVSCNGSVSMVNRNQGVNHIEKTVKCLASCESSISDHVKNKIVLQCVKDACLKNKSTLSENVAEKLRGLLSIYELDKYIHLASAPRSIQEEAIMLGIIDMPKYELSYAEGLDVKCCVEALLRNRIHNFILRYESLGGNMKEILRTTDYNLHKKLFESHDIQMLQWREKIEGLCEQYEADILKFKSLLNEWNKLKYQDMSQISLEKAEYILLQAQVAEIQAKISRFYCIIKMFNETPITIDAYRTLRTVVDEKLFQTMDEIKQKEDLKQQYENLKDTEYTNILKQYIDLCKAIKKKKEILEKL